MERPILISSAKMMRDFVVGNEVGIALDHSSEESAAKKIHHIYKNYPEIAKTVEKNARELTTNGEIFWDQTIKPLVQWYKKEFSL
jgi:hypothetical protein